MKDGAENQTAGPAIKSLGEFHVGSSRADPDVIEVRFVLTDKSEARDWAVWLFAQQELNDASR